MKVAYALMIFFGVLSTAVSADEFADLSAEQVATLKETALHNDNGDGYAFCRQQDSVACYVVLNGELFDVSTIEANNLAKLGHYSRADFDKVSTAPVEWLKSGPTKYVIQFRTVAQRAGKHYELEEPAVILNGRYIAR